MESTCGWFGTSGALVLGVIGIFIIAGLSAAPVLFLLAFLNAIIRELRLDRPHRSKEPSQSSLTLVMLDRDRHRNRAA